MARAPDIGGSVPAASEAATVAPRRSGPGRSGRVGRPSGWRCASGNDHQCLELGAIRASVCAACLALLAPPASAGPPPPRPEMLHAISWLPSPPPPTSGSLVGPSRLLLHCARVVLWISLIVLTIPVTPRSAATVRECPAGWLRSPADVFGRLGRSGLASSLTSRPPPRTLSPLPARAASMVAFSARRWSGARSTLMT